MNADQLEAFNKKHGFGVLHLPTVLGAAVPIYNVRGVSSGLNFTPEALAGIFLGRITKWNDPALTSANPNVKLPSSTILVIHRSDGSGLTYCWTDYLSQVSSEWKNRVGTGTSVNWPAGVAGQGNDGVAQRAKSSPNSIGYVELIYAENNKLNYGNVRNAAGAFIKPDVASIKAAAAIVAGKLPDDFRVSLVNTSAKNGYPITTFTWLLVPEQFKDPAKAKAMGDFVRWALTKGQSMAEPLTYSPLPPEVITKAERAVAKIR
jgi:phosphate transport system substrate-binding protein